MHLKSGLIRGAALGGSGLTKGGITPITSKKEAVYNIFAMSTYVLVLDSIQNEIQIYNNTVDENIPQN